MKRRSTRTVTVLSCTSLVTTPWSTRFGILLSFLGGFAGAFAHDRLDARDVAAHLTHACRVLELTARPLEAQIERFLGELGDLALQLVVGLGANVGGLHALGSSSPGWV